MANTPAVEVIGGARLRRTMRKAGADLKQLTELNRRAAATVLPVATSAAPRRSGRLASTGRVGATTRAGVVRFGRQSVPYAGPIHYGWPARNIKAQPWAVDAAHNTESRWVEIYLAGIKEIIDQIEGM